MMTTDAPQELYFYDDWLAQHTKGRLLCGNNKYIHEAQVDAMVAKAREETRAKTLATTSLVLRDSAILALATTEEEALLEKMLGKVREEALREAAEIAIDYGKQQYIANVVNQPQYADDIADDAQEIAGEILALIPTAEGEA